MTANENTPRCWNAQCCLSSGLRPESSFDCLSTLTTVQRRSQEAVISAGVWVDLLCLQIYHSWHKSALRGLLLWHSLALCYGVSKMGSKKPQGAAWAGLGWGLHHVSWLWRGTARLTVNHHPLPITGTIQWNTMQHCSKPRLSSPQTHTDGSVVLQLYINCDR